MPDEIEQKPEAKGLRLVKGRHTAATMKAHLAQKKRVPLPNGETVAIQASGIIFDGRVITDPAELPTDEEIDDHHKGVIARRNA